MDDLEYIRRFNRITTTKVCKKLKTQRTNVVSGRAPKDTIKKVREEIESEIAKLYIKED